MNPTRELTLGYVRLGGSKPLFLIAGPCVIESENHARKIAESVAKIAADAGVPYIFKSSFDKANRTSVKAFRGPGMREGLRILQRIKADLSVPVLTDIHDVSQAAPAGEVWRDKPTSSSPLEKPVASSTSKSRSSPPPAIWRTSSRSSSPPAPRK